VGIASVVLQESFVLFVLSLRCFSCIVKLILKVNSVEMIVLDIVKRVLVG